MIQPEKDHVELEYVMLCHVIVIENTHHSGARPKGLAELLCFDDLRRVEPPKYNPPRVQHHQRKPRIRKQRWTPQRTCRSTVSIIEWKSRPVSLNNAPAVSHPRTPASAGMCHAVSTSRAILPLPAAWSRPSLCFDLTAQEAFTF